MTAHRARKHFGQHFLHDEHVITRIIAALHPLPHEKIIEIGPGLGALTKHLLPLTTQLDVIELDRDIIPKLKQRCEGLGQLNVHQADALTVDFAEFSRDHHPLRLIGNLPYNISTPLLFHLLNAISHIQDMHFMLQKEVAYRLAASPGSRDYGRLSIMVQYECNVERLFDVPPTAFHPKPKVDSSVVRLVPHPKKLSVAQDPQGFEQTVKLAFNQRRKTIRNSLKTSLTGAELEQLHIDPRDRPENLSLSDFVKISNYIYTRDSKT